MIGRGRGSAQRWRDSNGHCAAPGWWQAQTAHDGSGWGCEGRATTPSFVELIAPQAGALAQCAIELEGRRGRIRIELKGTAADLASFSRTLGEVVF
jgi:hypothetical protein